MLVLHWRRKLYRTVLSIILCICIIGGVTVQSMYCAPFVIPLSSLAPIVAKILVTAGVTFLTVEGLKGLANECIDDMSLDLQDELRSISRSISNGRTKITTNVWNFCKSWVDTRYDTDTTTDDIVINEPWTRYERYPTNSLIEAKRANGNRVLIQWDKYVQPGYYTCTLDLGYSSSSAKMSNSVFESYVTMEILNDTEFQFRFFNTSGGYSLRAPSTTSALTGITIVGIIHYANEAVTCAPTIVDNLDYVHRNTVTQENEFVMGSTYSNVITKTPELINDVVVDNEISAVVGKTYEDIIAENVAGGEDVLPGQSYWDALLGKTADIYTAITTTIASATLSIKEALTGTIAGTLSDIRSNTNEEELESNNIFDFFISLLMILKHLVLIVLKFLVLVVVLKDIPAQSSLFNANTKAVIDYIHDHSLPMFNVSFMQIINAFIGILVAVSVIRIINKNVRANL